LWGIEPVKKWTAKVISRAVLRLTGSFRAGEYRSVRIAVPFLALLTIPVTWGKFTQPILTLD
jgi:hypothetical protein